MIELTFRGDFTKKLQERLTKEMIDVVWS
jgi:hypothetical protein